MRQRVTFIPSIVRSLKSITRRARSPEGFYSTPPASELNRQLWLLAQRKLYDKNASKNILSFFGSEDQCLGKPDSDPSQPHDVLQSPQQTSPVEVWNESNRLVDCEEMLDDLVEERVDWISRSTGADGRADTLLDDLPEDQNENFGNDDMLDDLGLSAGTENDFHEEYEDIWDEEGMLLV